MSITASTRSSRRFAAIVLAAGASRRFGSDKLSAPLAGEPLLFHAIRAARAAPVSRVLVVARSDLRIGEWQSAPPVDVIRIESDALSTSLKAGIAALIEPEENEMDGVFVFLGDMPCVPHETAHQLARQLGTNRAALPIHDGRPGHPVLLAASALPELAALTGDRGAGQLLKTWHDVAILECDEPAVTLDIDRPDQLANLKSAS